MELIESQTRQDADLGGTFISHKEVTINFNNDDLRNLYYIKNCMSNLDSDLDWDEEQTQALNDLLAYILENVSSYDLV